MKMSEQDVSNKFIGKLFSVEMMVIICGIVASYTTLAVGQTGQEDKIKTIEQKQGEIKQSVQTIITNQAVGQIERQHMKEDLTEQKQDIKLILEILERR